MATLAARLDSDAQRRAVPAAHARAPLGPLRRRLAFFAAQGVLDAPLLAELYAAPALLAIAPPPRAGGAGANGAGAGAGAEDGRGAGAGAEEVRLLHALCAQAGRLCAAEGGARAPSAAALVDLLAAHAAARPPPSPLPPVLTGHVSSLLPY